jgi:hypothetical protein
MTRSPEELLKFHRSLSRIDYTRQRMERLFQARLINITDVESVYEALFLRAVTSFETFLEDLFVAILERRAYYRRDRVRLRMTANSSAALRDVAISPYGEESGYIFDGRTTVFKQRT